MKTKLTLVICALACAASGATTVATWHTSPAARDGSAMAYDQARSQTVLYGGFRETGGFNKFDSELGETWVFDGFNWMRKTPAHSPGYRIGHSMVYDSLHQQTVLFGGGDNQTWLWDGNDWTPASPAHSPSARGYFAMAYDAVHNQVVLFGGEDNIINTPDHSDTWVWNGADWTQMLPASHPTGREIPSMAFDGAHQKVMLFGGFSYTAQQIYADTWLWDGNNWTLQSTPQNPASRRGASMAYDAGNHQVVLFGGAGAGFEQIYNDTWTWGASGWTQQSPPLSPSARGGAVMAYDIARAQTVLFGPPGDTWVWVGTAWGQKAGPANFPTGRHGQAMVYDAARGQTVLFGGYSSDNLSCFKDTWVYDGTNWTELFPAHDPYYRTGAAMVYDSVRHLVILFGGDDGVNFGGMSDTWVWDGTDWTQLTPANSPPPRTNHSMVYDAARQQVVLFGGTLTSDTWVFDGTNWTQKSPVHMPPPRSFAAMAYDAAHAQTLLYGGQIIGALVDSWVWDGNDWTQKTPVDSPGFRTQTSMVYDSTRGQIVLFGGYAENVNGASSDTWTWDGNNWEFRRPSNTPPPRYAASAAFDSSRGKFVVFGGYDGVNELWDTSEWDGGPVVTSNGFLYSHVSQTYNGTVSVKNVEAYSLVGAYSVIFNNLPPGVFVKNPSGNYLGSDYITFVPSPSLAPGQTYSFPVTFTGPFPTQIVFGAEIYVGSYLF